MPISGSEETAVKPVDGLFSEYSAGIPIKKRKFPLIWPPSEPTENESEQKGFSSPLQGSTTLNESIVATSSKTRGVEASLNTSGAAGSSNVSGVAASLNVSSRAATSNASFVAVISTASSVTAGSNVSSAVETSHASSVASSLSNVSSIAASVSSFSDASQRTVPEKEKRNSDDTNGSMVQGNSNLLRVKLEEQSFTVHSRSLADINSKGKLVAKGESDSMSAKSELDLIGNDSLTLNLGKDTHSQQNIDGECRLQLPTVFGNPGLSLGLREYLSDMASGNNEHGFQIEEKAEPVSLNLSLSKGECSTQLRSTDFNPNTSGANMLADRTNWDLNTTMDSWEGPASDDAASQTTTCLDDIKLSICSAGMTATIMPQERKMAEAIGCRAKIKMSSMLSSQQYSTVDSLRLGLTMPCLHLNSNEKPSSISANVDSCNFVANIGSPGEAKPVSKLTMVNIKPVKSEPLDSIKTNSAGVKAKPVGLLNITKVKSELVENCSSESSKSSTLNTLTLVDASSVKPEAVHEGNQEMPKRMGGSLNQSDEQMLRPVDTTTVSTSTGLSLHGDASTHREHFIQDKEIEPSGEAQVASKMISSVGHDANQLNISCKIDNSTSQNKNAEDPDQCKLKFMDVQLPDLRGTVEGSVSDEEKINLSGDILEDDSYGSDYESDDNRELSAAMDMENCGRAGVDFEDGEVREAVENTEIEVPICERQEAGNGHDGDTGYRNSDFIGFVGDNDPSSSSVKEETQREEPGKTNCDIIKEYIDTSVNKDFNTKADKEVCLQESSAVDMPSHQTDKRRPIKAMPRKSLDLSEKKDTIKGQEGEQTSIQASDTRQGTPVSIAQGADDARKTDSAGISNSVLPMAEATLNGDDASDDVNKGDTRSWIINLARASNQSSPGGTRPISGKTLPSQVGREKLPDLALEGDKFHPRGRDEAFGDGSHRFSKERHHDQPYRNNRISFMRGRGRISSRIETLHGNQDSERSFASDFNGPTEFHVVRHKYAFGADLNFSSYNNGDDGAYFGTGRSGRKILSDDSSISPHLLPRRQSPGGRDGPAARRLPMVRRVQRNFNPSRCGGEDGSELIGFRHTRGFADDHTDRMFARCQPSFEGLDGPFDRGNREFSSVHRRGLSRTHSKSPTRARTRSPGPWFSLRRRSPDGFGGPLELPHQRSPPIYRMERIRSPDSPCFAGEMALRRHGSPSYLSRPTNDLRVLDSGQDHCHPRSGIPNRSPSGRILLGNNRRLDLLDPRERNDVDDYFGRPMPSGRFHELGTDGNADERRRYVNRRGPGHPFRPPYSGADSESFHLNAEGGPRSFVLCAEDNSELHERRNMRGRKFDRRINNRPVNAPRRTRNIEEQEGNFRCSGQVWHDDGFDDMSPLKRKRF